jgi:DNA-directed RNA polymerase subunit H (RpoH/RPB5)
MSNISLITKIFKSRRILLEQLSERGYNIEKYTNFSLHELHILNQNKELDMYLEGSGKNSLFIKYHIENKLKDKDIYEYFEDLESSDLDENTELIVIINSKMNDTLKNFVKNLYFKEKKFVIVLNIHRLLFNILKHDLVPRHEVLDDEYKETLKKEKNIMTDSQFPEIDRFDPVAQAIGLKPGQICKIYRKSPTACYAEYYRLCC